jgi:mRNA-degrading endonuclease YafQ of YafQ-DinJ toxin-antitoxin module
MNKIILSPQFEKAYKKFVKRLPLLQNKIDESIKFLENNIYDTRLQTHKLSGKLFGSMACSCGYDCRIVFKYFFDDKTKQGNVLLISIGSHNEVY